MCTKFNITCILWYFPLCSIVLAQIALIFICKFGTWTSNLFFYFIVTIRDDDVESLCYCYFLLIYFHVSVSFGEVGDFCVDLYAVVAIAFVSKGNNYGIAFYMYCVYGNVTKFCETTLLNCEVFRSQSLWKLIHASAIYRKILFHDLTDRGDGRISPLMKVLHVLRRFCWLSPNLL